MADEENGGRKKVMDAFVAFADADVSKMVNYVIMKRFFVSLSKEMPVRLVSVFVMKMKIDVPQQLVTDDELMTHCVDCMSKFIIRYWKQLQIDFPGCADDMVLELAPHVSLKFT